MWKMAVGIDMSRKALSVYNSINLNIQQRKNGKLYSQNGILYGPYKGYFKK